ncbi:MAG TPA: hypothetical protein VGT61_02105 [Thermomicrobiales bacterium]|nr:hypothetical protein [Thermomicrobiales bacterium]
MKRNAIIGGVGALVIFVLIIVGLFLLGGDHQSALEKLRDIAIIFIVLSSLITVILLAAVTGALWFLVIQIKDKVVPMLEELTGTAKQVRNTASFVSDETVRPIINAAGFIAKSRKMSRVVTGKDKKIPNPEKL